MRYLVTIAAAISLSACASSSSQLRNDMTKISNFAIQDLKNAKSDADTHNDSEASKCYQALIDFVQKTQSQNVTGLFDVIQQTRDWQSDSKSLRNACAVVILDEEAAMSKLIAFAASKGL